MWLRFKFSICIFTAVSLFACILVAQTAAAKQTEPQTIVVFGDSLSAAYGMSQEQGWVSLLQKRLLQQGRNDEVVNASVSGETTSGGLSRFAGMIATHHPTIVIIELGANDGLRGLSAVETSNNIEAMIQQAKQSNAKVLLLGMKIPPNYGLKYSRQFSANYQNLAKKFSIPLVPFFLQGVAGNPALFQLDGLHPTALAQEKLLKNVWPTLNKMLEN